MTTRTAGRSWIGRVAAAISLLALAGCASREQATEASTSTRPAASATVQVRFVGGRLDGDVQDVERRDVTPYCYLDRKRAHVVVGAGTLATATRAGLEAAGLAWPTARCAPPTTRIST